MRYEGTATDDKVFVKDTFSSANFTQEKHHVHVHEAPFATKPHRSPRVYERWLRRFCGAEVALVEIEPGLFCLHLSTNEVEHAPTLPENFGYIGGVARAVLRQALDLPITQPRDTDIIYCGVTTLSPQEYKTISETFMPDDFAHGHGVQTMHDDYFATRDFTWNEVVYMDGQCVFTEQCLLDTVRNIVRFTDFVKQESWRGDDFFVSPKLFAKAIRFVAEAKAQGEVVRLANETDALQEVFVDAFHLSLHLDRAMSHSEEAAQLYISDMVARGFLPTTVETVPQALACLLGETDFIFRSELVERYIQEVAWLQESEKEATTNDDRYDAITYTGVVPFWHKKSTSNS